VVDTNNTEESTPDATAQAMVQRLMDHASMSATDISDALGQRVSRRTIYRWAKGESEPQQASDLSELTKLCQEKCS
tara:strand:- start:959 stop:1186 length:228 start_codon:yes stop_codon:yes gene_type:complete